nr:hypothetical protein [Micromonospora sp. DSM 115978]
MNPSETDLVDHLRRLRGEARGHTVSPGFADAVLTRVRRRARARVRVAGASALVLAVAVGVVVPLRVAGPWATDVAGTNAASPSVHSHGGFTVTWLPAGLRPRNDMTPTFDGTGGFTFEDSQDDPLFAGDNAMLAGFVHEQGHTT